MRSLHPSSAKSVITVNPQPKVNLFQARQDLNHLLAERATLTNRLSNGMVAIETARASGKDVTHWEAFWAVLLQRLQDTQAKIKVLQQLIEIHERRGQQAA